MPSWILRYRAGADPEAREYYDEVHDLRMDPYCTRLSAAEDPNQQGYVTVEVHFISPGPSNPRTLEILRRRDPNNFVHFPSLSAVVEANTQGLRPGDIASVGPDGVVGTTGTPIGTVISIEPDGNHVRVALTSERNPIVRHADRIEIAASELESITPHRFNIIESMQQRRSHEFQAEEDRRIFEALDSVAEGEQQPPRPRPARARTKKEPLPEPVRRTRFEKALDKGYIL